MLLRALGERIRVDCDDPTLGAALCVQYAGFRIPDDDGAADLQYRIDRVGTGRSFRLIGPATGHAVADGVADVLYRLESDLVVQLQRRRPELLFVHAAALGRRGAACLLAASSGVGKSTTAWALVHHGFSYASDELAPIDVEGVRVLPYPRALALKRATPGSRALPNSAVRVGAAAYLAASSLSVEVVDEALPIVAVFLLERAEGELGPRLWPLSASESAARLYVPTLNALAHPRRGLAVVLRLVRAVRCYRLALGSPDETAAQVRDTFDALLDACPAPASTRLPVAEDAQ